MLVTSSKRYLLFSIIFLLSVALPSCAPRSGTVRSGAAGINKGSIPTAHLWMNLQKYGEEEAGFATYTYVLVGRDASYKPAQDRYWALINAVRSSTSEKDMLPNVALKSKFNLFLIPVIKEGIEPSLPNEKLSILLLTALSTTVPGKFQRPGPYLITLTKPIRFGQRDEVADLLVLDLSDKHLGAIREYVHAYKERLVYKELTGIEKLESLRVNLLDTVLSAEDGLSFARIAFVELQKAFRASGFFHDPDVSFRSRETAEK